MHEQDRIAWPRSMRCRRPCPRRTGASCGSIGIGSRRCSPRPSSAAGSEPRFPPAVPDEDLVNALAQYLELDPLERQALLERDGVLARCRGLIELLEIKTLAPRMSWKGRSVH